MKLFGFCIFLTIMLGGPVLMHWVYQGEFSKSIQNRVAEFSKKLFRW